VLLQEDSDDKVHATTDDINDATAAIVNSHSTTTAARDV